MLWFVAAVAEQKKGISVQRLIDCEGLEAGGLDRVSGRSAALVWSRMGRVAFVAFCV